MTKHIQRFVVIIICCFLLCTLFSCKRKNNRARKVVLSQQQQTMQVPDGDNGLACLVLGSGLLFVFRRIIKG